MAALFLNSGIIFNIAKQASQEASAGKSLRQNALTAIIFSVVFLEAVINELAEIAADVDPRGESDAQRIQAFAQIMKQVEESHGSLELKYQLAAWVLGGHAFDKGSNPYQDFSLLVAVRNALVHIKLVDRIPVTSDGRLGRVEIPKVIQRLGERKILADIPETINTAWLTRLETAAMAQWACDSALAMVRSTVQFAPNGLFKNLALVLAQQPEQILP